MFGYIFTRLFIESFRLVPFRLLYIFSDILRFIFYYLIKYRKRVVFDNLRRAFPDKTKKEIERIAWASYRNLCDIMLESFKGLVISNKELLKRYKLIHDEVCNSYADKGQSAIYLAAHYANWEWAISIDLHLRHQIVSVFKPIKNKRFNAYMKRFRERFGMKLVPMSETRTVFKENSKSIGLVLIADQSPSTTHNSIWADFLNRDTPCIHGPEAYAKKLGIPLIFMEFQRVKRGFYSLEFFHFIPEPSGYKDGEITQAYMKRLEEYITRKPEDWIWTHKRWKHKRENGKIIMDYYYKW